jgi:hypothetical protein
VSDVKAVLEVGGKVVPLKFAGKANSKAVKMAAEAWFKGRGDTPPRITVQRTDTGYVARPVA